jgi:deoxyribonuclease-1
MLKGFAQIVLFFTLLWGEYSFAISNFKEAKKVLPQIFKDEAVTLYCGCKFTGKKIDLNSCGYKVYKNQKRALRLEWEHVVPAHAFGQSFREWREGDPKCVTKKKHKKFKGRKCAKTNPTFARMEGDLYNLYPEVGELNGLRSNFSMAALGDSENKSITFGACKAHILDRKFEPMERARGIVARIYMYMDLTYPGHGLISDKNRRLFEAWNKMYPVTKGECSRALLIRKYMGRTNPILDSSCKISIAR